ncbi:MAG: EAL domain-containing protein [Candidatus Reddybacter sp.]
MHATYILVSGFDQRVPHSAKKFTDAKNILVAKKLSKPINTKEFIHYISQLYIDTRLLPNNATTLQIQTTSNQQKLSLEQLKTAIRENQLVLFYQPKLAMDSGEVTGFEALVRLQHPKFGLIFPDQFIAMAEQHDLIYELTYEVFRLATEDYLHFRAAGINPGISINISAQDLLDLSMPEHFAALAKASDIPPRSHHHRAH